MKAISLWQPAASLVAVEAKGRETRDWAVPRGLLGQRIAIHAAKARDGLCMVTREPFARRLAEAREAGRLVEVYGQLPLGRLVATAVLADCVLITGEYAAAVRAQDPDEYAFGEYAPGRYAWDLRDVRRLVKPVPYRGAPRLFEVADELVAA